MAPFPKHNFVNVTGAITPTIIRQGRGTLHTLTINTTAASGIALIDGVGTINGTKIAQIGTSPTLGKTFRYDVEFNKGLTVVLGSATQDITLSIG